MSGLKRVHELSTETLEEILKQVQEELACKRTTGVEDYQCVLFCITESLPEFQRRYNKEKEMATKEYIDLLLDEKKDGRLEGNNTEQLGLGASEIRGIDIQDVIDAVEAKVSYSCIGPARASFEIPGDNNDTFIRGVYRSYIVVASTVREALVDIQAAIEDQIEQATLRNSSLTFLFWRNPKKIVVERMSETNSGFKAFTRFVVLPDDDSN